MCKFGSNSLSNVVSHSSKDQGCLLGKRSIVLAILFAPLSTRDNPIGSSNGTIQASNASLHFFLNIGRHFNLKSQCRTASPHSFNPFFAAFVISFAGPNLKM